MSSGALVSVRFGFTVRGDRDPVDVKRALRRVTVRCRGIESSANFGAFASS